MQCPACSTENPAGATFCQHCGASLSAAPPPPAGGGFTQVPQPATGPAAGPAVVAVQGLTDNAAAAIAYITIIPAIIFLVMEPYNRKPFVRFHAMQCIGLHVLSLAVWIALMILTLILSMIHMGLLVSLLGLLCWIGLVVLWILCIVSAAQGKWFKIPFVGDFARKQAGA
jgi:uncharacterized membrane protein